MTTSQKNNYSEGLEMFIIEFRKFAVSILKNKLSINWKEKFRESLNENQKITWDIGIKKGQVLPEELIDFQYLRSFSINFKGILQPFFNEKIYHLPTWFDEIALVRNHISHYTTDYLSEDDIDKGWIHMNSIARILKMKDLEKKLKQIRKRNNEPDSDNKTNEIEILTRSSKSEDDNLISPSQNNTVQETFLTKTLSIEEVNEQIPENNTVKKEKEFDKLTGEVEKEGNEEDAMKKQGEDLAIKILLYDKGNDINEFRERAQDIIVEPKDQKEVKAKTKTSASSLGIFIKFILIVSILFFTFYARQHFKSKPPNINDFTTPKEAESTTQQEVEKPVDQGCESNNTGVCIFSNNTAREIYVFLDWGSDWKTIKVEPNQILWEFNMKAATYNYNYGYFSDRFDPNNVKGTIAVEKCNTSELKLDLPKFNWYIVTGDDWTEINIPEGGSYAIIAPSKALRFRYSGDDKIYYATSKIALRDTAHKIYIKHEHKDIIEVCVEKRNPR